MPAPAWLQRPLEAQFFSEQITFCCCQEKRQKSMELRGSEGPQTCLREALEEGAPHSSSK